MSVLDKLIEEATERAGYMTLLAKMTDSGPGKNVAQEDADRMSRFATGMILARAELNEARSSTDAREFLHAKCDCVPDLGPAHCHLCSDEKGSSVPWPECSAVTEVAAKAYAQGRDDQKQSSVLYRQYQQGEVTEEQYERFLADVNRRAAEYRKAVEK